MPPLRSSPSLELPPLRSILSGPPLPFSDSAGRALLSISPSTAALTETEFMDWQCNTHIKGEDIVGGIRTPEDLDTMRQCMPEAYEELVENCRILEQDYKDMMNPGACLYTQDESVLSCDGSHQHTKRLCPCA